MIDADAVLPTLKISGPVASAAVLGKAVDCDVILRDPNSDLAQRVWRSRLERTRIFGAGLFADPAYDILLFLFIKQEAREVVSTLKVCTAASVPEPTALRYIRTLIKKGYVERTAHIHDRRVANLQLSEIGIEKIADWLARFELALRR